LSKLSGEILSSEPYRAHKGTSLDVNHTHFVLVNDGTTNFGAEVEFRCKFEDALRNATSCPGSAVQQHSRSHDVAVVSVVIQGGPGTIRTALNAKRNSTAIVVIEGSGKAADMLAYAWRYLHSNEYVRNHHTNDLTLLGTLRGPTPLMSCCTVSLPHSAKATHSHSSFAHMCLRRSRTM
jgi:hypothetical protein